MAESKEKEGKKPHKNKPTSKKYEKYNAEGKKTGKSCPRCGPGIFLGVHKDRLSCGKCKYTEFLKK
jgi:small subunit ribosomal protein S27Ae